MSVKRGWHWDAANSRLDVYVDSTEVAYFDDTGSYLTIASGLTITAGGLTVTAGGATVTAGGLTVSADGAAITGAVDVTGTLNVMDGHVLWVGVEATPGTTAGQNWIGIEDGGTDPAGTLANSLALYTPDAGDSLDFLHADGTTDSLGT